MFGLFKEETPPPKPCADKRWFILEVFDEIKKIEDPNQKIEKYVDVSDRIKELEKEFGIECLELELVRDDIREAFLYGTDPEVLYTSALVYGVMRSRAKAFSDAFTSNLPDYLKARLLRTYIISELDERLRDPLEFDLTLQHAFYEVEQRGLDEWQKAQVLSTEFGIQGWRSERKMNPHVIYD